MKCVFADIQNVFDAEEDKVNTVVIENPHLLYSVLTDIYEQINGSEGKTVISEDDKPVVMSKRVEMLSHFIPFSLNQKALLNRIAGKLESISSDGNHYLETRSVLSEVERYFYEISQEIDVSLEFKKLNIESLIKASGMEIMDSSTGLAERIVDYMELVTEFLGTKLFITYNLRNFLDEKEMLLFTETILSHGYQCIMIESFSYPVTEHEKRYTVDSLLCEIS